MCKSLDFGCKEFRDISENIPHDEGQPKESEEDLYSTLDVTANLRKAAHLARQADQPELVPKMLRLVTPLVEKEFQYGNLAELFGEMKIAAEESAEFLRKKRFLGKVKIKKGSSIYSFEFIYLNILSLYK